MGYDLIETLMKRDGISRSEARAQWDEFFSLFLTGEFGPLLEEAFMNEFGLEPDYIPFHLM